MDCDEFLRRLQDDGVSVMLTKDGGEHMMTCGACQKLLEEVMLNTPFEDLPSAIQTAIVLDGLKKDRTKN